MQKRDRFITGKQSALHLTHSPKMPEFSKSERAGAVNAYAARIRYRLQALTGFAAIHYAAPCGSGSFDAAIRRVNACPRDAWMPLRSGVSAGCSPGSSDTFFLPS